MIEKEENNGEELTKLAHITATDGNPAVCPVCLLEDVTLARTACKHEICLPCIQQIFAIPIPKRPRDGNLSDDDAHLDVPTRGRCPMCRSEICLFQLEPIGDFSSDDPSRLQEVVVKKNHHIASTGLRGRCYIQNRGLVGNESIHFPSGENDEMLPHVDFTNCERMKVLLGGSNSGKIYFQSDCHFHEPTRTFHGRLRLGDSCTDLVEGSLEWEYVLSFSADYQFVTRGITIKKRHVCQDPKCRGTLCKYPLDGRWRVSWPDQEGRQSQIFIVHNNDWVRPAASSDFEMIGIRFSGNRQVIAVFESGGAKYFESTVDFAEKKIEIGESFALDGITFNLEFDRISRMIWTRVTDTPDQEHIAVIRHSSGSGNYYHVFSPDETNSNVTKAKYYPGQPWGNTFSQGFTVGLASYHFMKNSDLGAYISYEHEQTSIWPSLDNGNPVPSKIWFTETSYDAQSRKFRGKIDWQGKHGTTWQGNRWWRYEMHFDEKFSCITGGYVMSVPVGSDVEQEMSVFGLELNYVNAAVVDLCYQGDALGHEVVTRAIETLQSSSSRNTFGLLSILQRAATGLVDIRYPRSFRRARNPT